MTSNYWSALTRQRFFMRRKRQQKEKAATSCRTPNNERPMKIEPRRATQQWSLSPVVRAREHCFRLRYAVDVKLALSTFSTAPNNTFAPFSMSFGRENSFGE